MSIIESLHRAQRGDAQKERERMKRVGGIPSEPGPCDCGHEDPQYAPRPCLYKPKPAPPPPWGTRDGPCPRCGHAERHYWSVPDAVCDGCGGRCQDIHTPEKPAPPLPSARMEDEEFEKIVAYLEFETPIEMEFVTETRRARASEAALREENERLGRIAERTIYALTEYADAHHSMLHDVGAWQMHARDVAASIALALKPKEGRDE